MTIEATARQGTKMSDFTTSYLAELSAGLTAEVVKALSSKAKQTLLGTEKERALRRCLHAGIAALLAQASTVSESERHVLDGIFREFFRSPFTGRALGSLLRGKPLDREEMADLFAQAGFDADTLPGLDFQRGLDHFEAAFLLNAVEEPGLQSTIQTAQLLEQTSLQRELLDEMRRFVAFVRGAQENTLRLQNGQALARDVGTGKPVVHQFKSLTVISPMGDFIAPGGTKIVHHHLDPAQDRSEKARRYYLESLRRYCDALPLAALGGQEGAGEEPRLSDVYIELDTTTAVAAKPNDQKKSRQRSKADLKNEAEERVLSALEAAAQCHRLVLRGDPGAGKSCFVRKVLGWLAAASLNEAEPPPGFDKNLLPILLTLRDLTPGLDRLEADQLPTRQRREKMVALVRDQILSPLSGMNAEAFGDNLKEVLHQGQGLLVLDGLDEVPDRLRPVVRETVAAVIAHYRMQRIIVTCRTRSYPNPAELPGFHMHTLAPLGEDKIRGFAQSWYRAQKHLTAKIADKQTNDLARAALSQDLRELSENPMMLTAMAIVHQREITLPKERVRIYHQVVEILSRRWQKHRAGEDEVAISAELRAFLKDDLKLRRVMEMLAFEAHKNERDKKQTADLERGRALKLLEDPEYLGTPGLADEFLNYVDLKAGLLVGRGGELHRPLSYSFPHRTFQEYLAGCHVAGQRNPAEEYFKLAEKGNDWALALQLGAEELLYNRRNPSNIVHNLVYDLSEAAPEHPQNRRALLWAGNVAAVLGRETILRDTQGLKKGPEYLKRLLPKLANIQRSELSAPERAEAGIALAHLCTREDHVLDEVLTIEKMQFCLVPAGPFCMGSSENDKMADSDERPFTKNMPLEYDYWMSRFPITQAQFVEFVNAGGYETKDLWAEAIAAKIWQKGKIKGRYDDKPREGPEDYVTPFTLPNHPVVGITWYEALAFARWLEKFLRDQGLLSAKGRAILPSEPEWEKAARGGWQVPASTIIRTLAEGWEVKEVALRKNEKMQQLYPWGDTPNADFANYADTGIRTTSAAGCFAGAISPYGCEEMSGNVWEWTRSVDGDYPYPAEEKKRTARENLAAPSDKPRVLRGGAFHYLVRLVRCAYRFRLNPDLRDDDIGFRVAVRP